MSTLSHDKDAKYRLNMRNVPVFWFCESRSASQHFSGKSGETAAATGYTQFRNVVMDLACLCSGKLIMSPNT